MIVIRIKEGLGNQMFQYAFARSLSLSLPYEVKLDIWGKISEKYECTRYSRSYGLNNFKINLDVASKSELRKWSLCDNSFYHKILGLRKGYKSKYNIYFEEDFNYDPNKKNICDNMYLVGWFQNELYFNNIRRVLLAEFKPRKKVKIPKVYSDIMKYNTVISIHIRRGDYVTDKEARKYLGPCKRDYYKRAIKYISEKVTNPFYLIFTDDISWAKINFHCNYPFAFVSDIQKYEDWEEMILMSKCKHNIIANSTFSWWGAWLNTNTEKIVIAPEKWFRDCSKKHIAARGWILI